ncbi:MAG TPA: zinc finger Ran-binding domain-containing protein [Gemmatimonadales bacterium]|nr:zinc finger Ran-binding domain-containing protein [Gemmatimonadales bacterium]
MTRTDTELTIEELLEQRTQYEEWLAKLDASGDKAPPAVRQRVRGDYEARLQQVLEQLRGRGTAISEELERHHASQAELDRERRAAEEALAEAEVRHSVGEYTEDEWRRISEESRREIDQLRSKLRGIGAEITRLTQIQSVVTSPRAGASAPPSPPPPRPSRPEVVEQAPLVTNIAEEPVESTNRFAPKPQAPEPAPVDELAFLKSVGPEEEARPIGRRVSNPGMQAPAVQTAMPSVGKAAAGVAKTLKCGECGTLNRPTEWYCERCGAELAGI